MRNNLAPYGYAVIASALSFIAIVVTLTLSLPGYDFRHQLMSELALGSGVFFAPSMFFAFLALAFPFFTLCLARIGCRKEVRIIAALAAAAFVGAGVFPLDVATDLHVALVAMAFIASGLTMYGLAAGAGAFDRWRGFSRILLVSLALSAASGSIIPIGIAQRLAAATILIWFIGIGIALIRHK